MAYDAASMKKPMMIFLAAVVGMGIFIGLNAWLNPVQPKPKKTFELTMPETPAEEPAAREPASEAKPKRFEMMPKAY